MRRAEELLSELNSKKATHSGTLTSRETVVLRHVASGKMDKEIASELGISDHTVHNHVRKILTKLGVGNRTEAANTGRKNQLL